MTRSNTDRFGIIAAYILVIITNYLSNALPINGTTMSEISATYPTLFTPAGFTFSVWGVIYLSLIAFSIYQALPGQKNSDLLSKISPLFIINCLLNCAWIVVWHYGYLWASLIIMLGLLTTLILILRILWQARPASSFAQRTFVFLPFSIYAGWITAATIANLSIVQFDMNWNDLGLSAVNWTYLKLALAGAIGAFMILRKQDIAFVLVIAWAAFGISRKQIDTPEIVGAATVLCVLAILLAALSAMGKLKDLTRA